MGVATLMSVDPAKSFWSNFERMEGYITTLHLFVYFVMVGAVASVGKLWERFMQVAVASGALMGCYAMLQLAGVLSISSQSGPRVDSTFGNAAYLGVFMLFSVFITLFLLVRHHRSALAQALYGIALVLEVASLYYTETRGALLGLVLGLVVAAGVVVVRGKEGNARTMRRYAGYGLGAVALLALLFVGMRDTSFVKQSHTLSRVASISLTETTTLSRFVIWSMAVKGVMEKPVFGWGQENFNFVFNKHYSPSMYDQEQWFDRAHNQFLDWLIAGGFPAFILYISLFILAGWVVLRSELTLLEQALLIGLLVGYAFNNLVVFDNIMSSIYFFFVLAFLHSLSKRPLPAWLSMTKPVSDETVALVAPFVLTVVLLGAWSLNAPGIARAEGLVNAITQQVGVADAQGNIHGEAKNPKLYAQQFSEVLTASTWPGTSLGRQESVEQLLQIATSMAGAQQVPIEDKQAIFTLGQSQITSLLADRPHDARLELFAGVFYASFGKRDDAIEVLKKSLADSPNKQQILFQIGVTDLNGGSIPDAVEALKTAFDLEPSYKDARILYASSLFYAGQTGTADKILTDGFGATVVDDPRLETVYFTLKMYDRLIAVRRARVADNPTNVKNHLDLADALFTAGDRAGSVAELRQAETLDPSIKPQVEPVIGKILDGTLK